MYAPNTKASIFARIKEINRWLHLKPLTDFSKKKLLRSVKVWTTTLWIWLTFMALHLKTAEYTFLSSMTGPLTNVLNNARSLKKFQKIKITEYVFWKKYKTKNILKTPEIWKLTNILPNNPWDREKDHKGNKSRFWSRW